MNIQLLKYNSDRKHREEWYNYFKDLDVTTLSANKSRVKRTLKRLLKFKEEKRFRIWVDTYAKILTGNKPKTMCRDMPILPICDGYSVKVHNGKAYTPVDLNIAKTGRPLGEFVETRVKCVHSTSKKTASSKTKTGKN